jgi:cysteine synthase
VLLTRSDVKGHPAYYQDYARRLADETPGAFYIDQFNNDANPLAHATTTAPEIFQQLEGDIDAIVVGVGSGGTLGGLQAWFAEHSRKRNLSSPIRRAPFLDQVETGRYGETGSWLVEGIGEDLSRRWPIWKASAALIASAIAKLRTAASCCRLKAFWQAPPPAPCSAPPCATAGRRHP